MSILMSFNIILFICLFSIYRSIWNSTKCYHFIEVYSYSVVPIILGIYNLIAFLISKNYVYLGLLILFIIIFNISIIKNLIKTQKKYKNFCLIAKTIRENVNLEKTDKISFAFQYETKQLKIKVKTSIKIDNKNKEKLEAEILKLTDYNKIDIFFEKKINCLIIKK